MGKSRKLRRFIPPKISNRGTTYIEAVTALAIMSVLSVGLYNYLRFASDNSYLLHDNIIRNIGIFQCDRTLRKETARISPPFWSGGESGFGIKQDAAVLPFYDGNREKILKVEFRDETVFFSADETALSFLVPGTEMRIEPLAEDSVMTGLIVRFLKKKTGDEVYSAVYRFGGTPLQ